MVIGYVVTLFSRRLGSEVGVGMASRVRQCDRRIHEGSETRTLEEHPASHRLVRFKLLPLKKCIEEL